MQLHRALSSEGRKWVREVWQATQDVRGQHSLLGPVATALETSIADAYAASEGLEGQELSEALRSVMRIGYAARTVLGSAMDQLSLDWAALGLDLPTRPPLDAGEQSAAGDLVISVERIANQDFHTVMTLPEDVWAAYVALATREVQRTVASGSISWRDLGFERVEGLLRHGYVLRCLDEVTTTRSRT
jgi:hypothetical protein